MNSPHESRWGGRPRPRRTPWSGSANALKRRPTRASAAVQGDRPTCRLLRRTYDSGHSETFSLLVVWSSLAASRRRDARILSCRIATPGDASSFVFNPEQVSRSPARVRTPEVDRGTQECVRHNPASASLRVANEITVWRASLALCGLLRNSPAQRSLARGDALSFC